MRAVRRRRIFISMAVISTLAFIIYGKGAVSGPYPSRSQLSTEDVDLSERGHNNEEGSLTNRVQPSVFKLWRDQPPRKQIRSLTESCKEFKGLGVRRLCEERLRHVRDFCSRRQTEEVPKNRQHDGDGVGGDADGEASVPKTNDSVVDVFSYRQEHRMVMFCSVHKVASTFWIRLFRFLHKDTGAGPVFSPEAISKYKAHLSPFKESRPLALAYITRRKMGPGDDEFRFMFTRNPYRRLWAVYVDKFVLPDFFFWSYHGRAIKEMILISSGHGLQQQRKPMSICSEVNFKDFVQYVVQEKSSPTAHSDNHLLPVSGTCDPCAFQPNFVGRMENMTDDSQAVLESLQLGGIMKRKDFHGRILDQIRTVTEFVHDTVVERGNLRHCVSDDELQGRLLRAFILSGYLPPKVVDVRHTSAGRSVTELLNMMKELFLLFDRSQAEIEEQKQQFFVTAYDSLPRDLLYQVRDYYKDDFDVFEYDPEPPELFAQREERERSMAL